jgi:hypothetical protein
MLLSADVCNKHDQACYMARFLLQESKVTSPFLAGNPGGMNEKRFAKRLNAVGAKREESHNRHIVPLAQSPCMVR